MIIEEQIDGTNLVKRYSNRGMMLLQDQTDVMYAEAVDIDTSSYTYTETDVPIDGEELTDSEALAILLGGELNESDESDDA